MRCLLFLVLVGLNVLDYHLTVKILLLGGYEANPIVAAAIERFGFDGILYVKALPLLLLGTVVFGLWHKLSVRWRTGTYRVIIVLNWCFIALCSYSFGVFTALTS